MFFLLVWNCASSQITHCIHTCMHNFIHTHPPHTHIHNVPRPRGPCEFEILLHIHSPSHSLHKALNQMQSVYGNKQWLKHLKGKVVKIQRTSIINNMHSHSCKMNDYKEKAYVSQPDSQKIPKYDDDVTTYKRKVKVQLLRR